MPCCDKAILLSAPSHTFFLFPFYLWRMMKQDFSLFLNDIFTPFQHGIGQGNAMRFFVMGGKIKLLPGCSIHKLV